MNISKPYFHYQDFKKDKWYYDPNDKSFAHGRFFLKPNANSQSELSMEWVIGSKRFDLSTEISKSYVAEHTILFIFAIPPISLYTKICWPWLEKRKLWSKLVKENNKEILYKLPDGTEITKHAENLETGIRIFNWTVLLDFLNNTDEWKSSDPWWKRCNFNVKDIFLDLLLGKMEHKDELVKETSVKIPMPEKEYDGIAKVSKVTRKRKKWYPKIDYYTEIRVEKGVPHPGKGTTSYNCGTDGLVSTAIKGENINGAIANFVKVAVERRLKYPL